MNTLEKYLQICPECQSNLYDQNVADKCHSCAINADNERLLALAHAKAERALDRIHNTLDGKEWDSDTFCEIVDTLEATGRFVSAPAGLADDDDNNPGCDICGINDREPGSYRCYDCIAAANVKYDDESYFNKTRGSNKPGSDSNISRDDQNRRLRESRLGFAAPSDDWAECTVPVVCIFPGQVPGLWTLVESYQGRDFHDYNDDRNKR